MTGDHLCQNRNDLKVIPVNESIIKLFNRVLQLIPKPVYKWVGDLAKFHAQKSTSRSQYTMCFFQGLQN